ncbi:MAG TPA: ABC transporter ATP-binding protein [Segetibacter sp.]
MNFLKVAGISKKAETGFVLKDVNFVQRRLQKIAIAGETGSGKSTLLKIIAGLVQAGSGEVQFKEERVAGPDEKLIPGHPRIAYLSQHFELRNNYKVEEVLVMANKMTEEDAVTIYEVCRITHLLKRRTDRLSGGEKQRIAIARLLISSPQLLLLDEPYSNLDMVHKKVLKSVIGDISEKLEITCILISHDPLDTLSWADEILVMKDGEIIQKGTPRQVYSQPVNEYAAGLFGSYTLISPALTASLTGDRLNVNEKKILIRPEQFKISAAAVNALPGKVQGVRFFGGFCELDVELSNTTITVKTEEVNFFKGDGVYVTLDGSNIWYL